MHACCAGGADGPIILPVVFRRVINGTVAAALALTTLAVAGQSLVGLDDCYSRLDVEARVPGCCHHADVDTVEDVHHRCCLTPFVADLDDSSTTASTPDVPAAALSTAAQPVLRRLAALSPNSRGFHPVVERPPDRAPPIGTIVLVI